jgi:hypothetical protein
LAWAAQAQVRARHAVPLQQPTTLTAILSLKEGDETRIDAIGSNKITTIENLNLKETKTLSLSKGEGRVRVSYLNLVIATIHNFLEHQIDF